MATIVLNIEHDDDEHGRNVSAWRDALTQAAAESSSNRHMADQVAEQIGRINARIVAELLSENCDADEVQHDLSECRALLELLAEANQR